MTKQQIEEQIAANLERIAALDRMIEHAKANPVSYIIHNPGTLNAWCEEVVS